MFNINIWLKAARLRTLPLSLSGVILGGFLAYSKGYFQIEVLILSLLTTILFQIISNFSNDLGDGIRGTDADRVGEKRMIASGEISPSQIKKAILILIIISISLIITLLYFAFFPNFIKEFWIFIGLGLLCILAALGYTLGKNAYGYLGLGDVFVFLFFGGVGVLGSEFLYTKSFDYWSILPAASIGFFSVAVLNLNNMRDMENDKKHGKKTMAIRLGLTYAKIYEMMLLTLPFPLCAMYVLHYNSQNYKALAFLLIMFLMSSIRRKIFQTSNLEEFDQYLKPIALLTFIFSILFGFCINNFFT